MTPASLGACLTGRVPCLDRQGDSTTSNLVGWVPCTAGLEAAPWLGRTLTSPRPVEMFQSTYDLGDTHTHANATISTKKKKKKKKKKN
jgi:hypothetical protein